MEKFLVDTHALIWYAENNPKLGSRARETLDLIREGKILILVSLMSFLEMDYLIQKNKISPKLPALLEKYAVETPNSSFRCIGIDWEIYHAFLKVPPKEIPELPDRVIVATAMAHECPLITKDTRIAQWGKIKTIW